MLPTSIHISAFLTPIYCLALCQISLYLMSILALLFLFFIFSLGSYICLPPCNISSQCKSGTANWYWINYSMFGVCVCVCLSHAVASLQRDFTRWLPLLIHCRCLFLSPHKILFSGLKCSVWTPAFLSQCSENLTVSAFWMSLLNANVFVCAENISCSLNT